MKGLMVDAGATSHIITDKTKFKSFDETFRGRHTAWSWLMVPSAEAWPKAEEMPRCFYSTTEDVVIQQH